MRTVIALVTASGRHVHTVPEFTVDSPWWNDVEPVTAHLDRVLGVPTHVLRLVTATGTGMRGGTVTYEVEAAGSSTVDTIAAVDAVAAAPGDALRLPWARPGGPSALVEWAEGHVVCVGPAVQVKTWNLSCLFRLRTKAGTVWAKEVPSFLAPEGPVLELVRSVDPSLAPTVMASEGRRILLEDAPGTDCWSPSPAIVQDIVPRWVGMQNALAGPARLRRRGVEVPSFGLPDTLLHGDFHPGNWRSSGVVLDWGEAHWGHPALDAAKLVDFVDPSVAALVEEVWCRSWLAHHPDSDPSAALRHARPAMHLLAARVYQEFLDNIEESERIYHRGDPEEQLALAQSFTL
ncbi:phosphotransferase [Saccharothrix variisporea]|uniref:Phosphotransferase family enzyme n=1 Tax=Saccharothrix variisporea TaxID=543527 RepID=A0A495XK77_9PSEU|nr:phosphotransferase [Saccharothrix variisporea]RKT72813.1 phosphotransferase family enzyme [Saccharothrix variisporea]